MAKKLTRSKKDRMLGGVAGGLAKYFEIDPTIVRIIFVVLLFLEGFGFLAYIILWIVVPEEGEDSSYAKDIQKVAQEKDKKKKNESKESMAKKVKTEAQEVRRRYSHHDGKMIGATVLIVLGLVFLINNFVPALNFGKLWPIFLIIIGLALLFSSVESEEK